MNLYCVGFLFDERKENVLLLRKSKPAWQKGKLNGIGGKLFPEETPLKGMNREGKEELGFDVTWKLYAVIYSPTYILHVFKSFDIKKGEKLPKENDVGETFKFVLLDDFHNLFPICVYNLPYLIPLALDDTVLIAQFSTDE